MDKQQYHDKALSLLNDKSTYAALNSNPTSRTQRKLHKLLDLKNAVKISDHTYTMLYSSDGLCPRFYGLPKIPKPGIPLRPIVSFVNSPTYAISGHLARILSPVVRNTNYTVKIPANLRISQEIKLLTLVKNQYLSTLFRSSLKSQLVTEDGNGSRGTKCLSHFTG